MSGDLHAEIEVARDRLETLRSQREEVQARLSGATQGKKGYLRHRIDQINAKIADVELRLGRLIEEDMRRANIDEEAVTNPIEFPWRAQRRLQFGDKVYQRGAKNAAKVLPFRLLCNRRRDSRRFS
jgi:hypothetical protein